MDIKDVIINQSVGNLYWKDTEGRFLGCNNTFLIVVGLSSQHELMGKTDYDLFLSRLGKEKVAETCAIDQQIMQEGKEKTMEEVGLDAEAKVAYYLTRKAPLKNKEGKVIGLVGTSLDITKEKQAMLAKQRFLENMSHDIRTPLSGICGLSRILYQDYDREKLDQTTKREMLGDIMHAADTLLEFLDHVLQISENSNLGKYPIQNESIHLPALITEVMQLTLPEMKRKQLKSRVTCPDLHIKTDRFRLLRILLNLVANAVKFTQKGEININVDTQKAIIIEIEDTGIGIPDTELEQIFEKFHKVKPSNQSAEFTGCGVGLYLVKLMANEIGAKLSVESRLTEGSKFSVTLAPQI